MENVAIVCLSRHGKAFDPGKNDAGEMASRKIGAHWMLKKPKNAK